jgi:hypothetical protein
MKKLTLTHSYLTNPTPAITRNLEEGPDYQPDCRNRVVQHYLGELSRDPEARSQKLAQIIVAEPDEEVIDLLLFHLDGPAIFAPFIDYALRCVRANPTNGVAGKIKAMILADFSWEEIASELGARTFDIHAFEYLFFDVRRYRVRRTWLRGICYPHDTEARSPEEMYDLRLLQIAFNRGKAGVREDILGHASCEPGYKPYPPTLGQLAKKAVQRASEFYAERDLTVQPDEMDVKALAFIGRDAENFDHPIFAAQIADQPALKTTPWSLEQLASVDWEKVNSGWSEVVNELRAYYRTLVRRKLALTMSPTAQEKSASGKANDYPEGYAINWAEVLKEFDALEFGVEALSSKNES